MKVVLVPFIEGDPCLAGSRSTVSGLQLRPPTGHDLTPRSEPSSDQERKRPRSEHDSGGGGGGEPAPSLPPSGPPTTTSSNGDDGSVIKRPKIEDPGSGSGEENNSVDGMESKLTQPFRRWTTDQSHGPTKAHFYHRTC
ncbi:hypothetical protein FJT64_010637 [Amphibalanus amphitrite]|uniref:Uncharacterized protein n=1 Tax=Amphibalanus amphitrite TaxID=1232801 RepID=A0A6A4VI41_AMPAM|nr:hypothetical protein FJT64_010637 [Amphibalanus amphitrite]